VDVVRRNYDRAQINLDLMFMKAAIEQDAPGAVWENPSTMPARPWKVRLVVSL
jgi:hypothetical protein